MVDAYEELNEADALEEQITQGGLDRLVSTGSLSNSPSELSDGFSIKHIPLRRMEREISKGRKGTLVLGYTRIKSIVSLAEINGFLNQDSVLAYIQGPISKDVSKYKHAKSKTDSIKGQNFQLMHFPALDKSDELYGLQEKFILEALKKPHYASAYHKIH